MNQEPSLGHLQLHILGFSVLHQANYTTKESSPLPATFTSISTSELQLKTVVSFLQSQLYSVIIRNIMLSYVLSICVIASITTKLFVICVKPELQLVNLVFRHGDRAPGDDETYPNDPYLHWNYHTSPGNLTDIGKMRCETLGQHLHDLYGDFLSDSYVPEEIYARSTGSYRTKECLKLALCAWYSKDRQLQDSAEGCQPETYSADESIDLLLRPKKSQPFREERNRVMELPEVKIQIDSYRKLMRNLTRITGKEIETITGIKDLYNTLTCESSHRLKLPAWTEDIYPSGILSNAMVLYFQINNWNEEIRRVNGGILMRRMVDNIMTEVENHGINKTRMYLYSAHEDNVASAEIILRTYNPPSIPKFTSAAIIELLSQDHEYYVRIRYYEGIPARSSIKTIPGCVELCPIQQFIKLIEDNLPSSEEIRGDS